jgi:hypothetical protein
LMRFLLKRIFFVTATSSLVIGGLFIFPQHGKGYDDQTTHPALTDEIVDFYNLSFSDKLTDEEKEWIVEGSINEDTPPRWINHFYDPTTREGWKSENLGEVPPIALKIFSRIFLNATTETVSSKNWVHNELLQVKYADYGGNRTWENAIRRYVNGDKEYAYRTLGDILHLLEDKTVPDHTRNDTHAHEGSLVTDDGGSPYEDYSSNYTRGNLVIAPDLKKENKSPIIFGSLDEYFDYLANYSNNNFFSEHTINSGGYEYPKILREDGVYGYGVNKDGVEFSYPLSNIKFIPKENFDIEKFYTLKNNQNENLVLSSYFSRLSREAVLSGAGVIKLFHEEVAKAEKDRNLIKKEPTISWWQKMRSPGYGVIIPTIHATVNGVTWAYNSAKATISNIVTINVTRPVGDFATNQTASLLDAVSDNKVAVVERPVLVNNTVQGESLDGVSSGVSSGTVATPTPNTIQSLAVDSTSQSISAQQAPVFVSGAMPIVAVPAPVVASQPQTTQVVEQEVLSVVQNPAAEVPATTTPEIVVDTTSPIITILGENPINVLVGGQYVDLGATALDDVDGSRIVTASSSVNVFTEGDYSILYTASDLSGNIAHATRTVQVVPTLATFSFSDLNNNGIADSDEENVLVDANNVLPAGEYRFNNLTIASSSTLTLQGDPLSLADFKGVKIVAQNITVEVGSFISADYQGYKTGGPGSPSAPAYLAGASYGGVGTGGGVPSYGDALSPTELGSNGGVCCGNYQGGGGAMHFIVSGTFLNNGIVSANGSGSSSGGSIYGVVDTLAGSGIFQANGGAHSVSSVYYGRAGGGRTALYYQTSSFSGASTALGGCSSLGMGYAYECAGNGTAGLFDTKNNDLYISSSWRFGASEGPFSFNRIVVTNGAHVEVEDGVQLSAHELSVDSASTFSITGSSVISIPTISVDDNSTLTFSGRESLTLDTLSATENSTISVTQGSPLLLHVRDLTVSTDSKISLDSKGYSGGTGPGAPIEFYDGASHGGVGYYNSATSTYGSITEPVEMGSGGNGHYAYAQGGGALKIVADGTLVLDGEVSARGGITSSGGSIYIIAHRLEGNGQIVADGGSSYWAGQYIGMGGGGRIAVTAEQYAFTGSMSALGGCARFDGWTLSCAGNGTIENSNELELVIEEEVPVQEEENATPVVLDTTSPIITIGAYDSITATSSPITVTASTTEGVLNAESHTFNENGSFDFVATDDAGNSATTTVTIGNIDTTPPSITSYTLNDTEGNVEMLVSTPSPVTLVLHASENVDWVSLRIEHSEDASIYKVFYSGAQCVDDTAVCTKVWDTTLSKGDLIEGTYRIKAHFRDAVGNDVTEYLDPYVIIVQGVPVENAPPAPVLEDLEPVL